MAILSNGGLVLLSSQPVLWPSSGSLKSAVVTICTTYWQMLQIEVWVIIFVLLIVGLKTAMEKRLIMPCIGSVAVTLRRAKKLRTFSSSPPLLDLTKNSLGTDQQAKLWYSFLFHFRLIHLPKQGLNQHSCWICTRSSLMTISWSQMQDLAKINESNLRTALVNWQRTVLYILSFEDCVLTLCADLHNL